MTSRHSSSPDQSRTLLRRRTAVRLGMGALVMGILLVGGYFLFVGTPIGQGWDNAGYAGRQVIGGDVKLYDGDILHEVSRTSLFIALGCILFLSVVFRCPESGMMAVLAVTVAVFGAEFLKHNLPRLELVPPLGPVPGYFSSDTYPSGHTTIGTSIALALVMISGPGWRSWTAVVSGFLSVSYATAVLFIGWHRPSDAVGGLLWSGFCFSLAAACTVLVGGHYARPRESPNRAPLVSGVMALCLAVGVLLFSANGGSFSGSRWPFSVMTCLIICAGFALPAWFAFALRPISWRSLRRY